MSTPENLPEIYRTHTTKGARYHVRGTHPAIAHRLFPLAKDAAELAISQGAVVYEKRIGEHWILAEEAAALDAAQHAAEQHDRDELELQRLERDARREEELEQREAAAASAREREALLEERAEACERFLAQRERKTAAGCEECDCADPLAPHDLAHDCDCSCHEPDLSWLPANDVERARQILRGL